MDAAKRGGRWGDRGLQTPPAGRSGCRRGLPAADRGGPGDDRARRAERGHVTRLLVLPLALLAGAVPFHSSIEALPAPVRAQLKRGAWHRGCPVPLWQLRVLTVSYVGFDGQAHRGQLVVNRASAAPLARVFRELYRLRFPIRHLDLASSYGPAASRPADGDVSSSLECRQAVPSPCVGGRGTGSWSEHAYGEAVDLNPLENPYVGCGQSRDPATRRYFNRSV